MSVDVAGWFDANLVSILNGVAIGLLLFTTAVGLSLIFGLMDVLNLAHGGIFLLGAYIAFQFTQGVSDAFFVAAGVAIVVGLVLGVLLAGAVRPIAHRGHLDQALLTFGFALILADVISIIWGRDLRSVQPPEFLAGSVPVLDAFYPRYRFVVIGVGLVLALLVYLGFERTRLGAVVRAAVEDRAMVSALGIRVNRVLVGVLAAGVALAAFGGVIGAPVLGVRPGLDFDVLILSLIVVVIGGLGSVRGAFVGAILIGEVRTLGTVLFPEVSSFLLFGAMALVLLFRPTGLFGEAT